MGKSKRREDLLQGIRQIRWLSSLSHPLLKMHPSIESISVSFPPINCSTQPKEIMAISGANVLVYDSIQTDGVACLAVRNS